jgi:hypothetical protein
MSIKQNRKKGRSSRYPFRFIGMRAGPAAGALNSPGHPVWLPFLDTYRTMCRAPEPAFRRILEDIRALRLAA